MKKPLYITVLTAFTLVCALAYANYNLLIYLFWIVEIAVLFAGEFIGIRAGRRTSFGEKYGENIGAAVSSALILAAYLFEVLIVPSEFRSTALSVMYYPIGAAAVISLVINGGNIAAKKLVTFRARHGAPPSSELTLKKFLPHLFIASGIGSLNAAQTIMFFVLGMWTPMFNGITAVIDILLRVQIANVLGIFINRLVEKRLANNILIAAAVLIPGIKHAKAVISNKPYNSFFPEELLYEKYLLLICGSIIAADIVWAVLKLRKGKTGHKTIDTVNSDLTDQL